MSSPKSNLNRFAIAILLVSNIALCIFSLNKTVNEEEPNALIYRHHLKELETWYSNTDIAALRNLALNLTAKNGITYSDLIFIVIPINPCGECLNEECERITTSCNDSQNPVIIATPEHARRNIAAKLSECNNITILTYDPEDVKGDKTISSFSGLIYMAASNKQVSSIYLSDIYAPEATEQFLKHHIQ